MLLFKGPTDFFFQDPVNFLLLIHNVKSCSSASGVCFIQSVDCSSENKDGKYIFELVDKGIEDISVINVVQVVTDNTRANEAAASYLRAKRPSIYWNGCAANYIDLILEDIEGLPNVDN